MKINFPKSKKSLIALSLVLPGSVFKFQGDEDVIFIRGQDKTPQCCYATSLGSGRVAEVLVVTEVVLVKAEVHVID